MIHVDVIHVNGKAVPWHGEMAVTTLIRTLREAYIYPVVRIDNKIISRPLFDQTAVPDGTRDFLIPLVAGG